MRHPTIVVVLVLLVGAVGCARPRAPESAVEPPAEELGSPRAAGGQPLSASPPEAVPPGAERVPATAPPITGDVPPELLGRIVAELVAKTGLSRERIGVVRGERVVWPDGALGCPERGSIYPQIPVPGYWVVLSDGSREYDYRVGLRDDFRQCTRPMVRPLPGGGGNDSIR